MALETHRPGSVLPFWSRLAAPRRLRPAPAGGKPDAPLATGEAWRLEPPGVDSFEPPSGGGASTRPRGRVDEVSQALRRALESVRPYLPARYIERSLVRRIMVTNMVGLGILLSGLLFINQHNAWLIDAKLDSLEAQSRIIAAALATNPSVDNTGNLRIDPDKVPSIEGALVPFRDDGFAALELSLRPERVSQALRKMIDGNQSRARVFARDLTMVADSARFLQVDQIGREASRENGAGVNRRQKDLWTRITQWMLWTELPVHRDMEANHGSAFREVRTALNGVSTRLIQLSDQGERIVTVAAPIQRGQAVLGVLLLSTLPGDVEEAIAKERNLIAMFALLAICATLAASFWLARTVAGPMKRLSEAAEHVSQHISARRELPDYSDRPDEVGQMSRSFRTMTAALYRRIEASDKFAADVTHELKNPLAAARSLADALALARTPQQREQLVGQIQHELKRLNRLIGDVASHSRLDAELARQTNAPVDVLQVASGVVQSFRDLLSDDTRRVEIVSDSAAGELIVDGHDGRLAQVLTNLIDNAVSFLPENGTVTVRLLRDATTVYLAVEDEGPGIPSDKLEKIFDRFYTDRPLTEATQGKNSGLGLSICREIVAAHGGHIWAENLYASAPPGRAASSARPAGARFVVRLPAAGAPPGPATRTLPGLRRRG